MLFSPLARVFQHLLWQDNIDCHSILLFHLIMSFTDLDFADYEIILIKKEEIMAATFKALGQEAKSLVLKGS